MTSNDPNYPEVPPTLPVTPPVPQSPWTSPTSPAPGAAPPPPPPNVQRRPPTKILAVVVGVVALVGGGAFAVQSFGDDQTGAASPEEAAQRLVEAIADEDILGVVDLLPDGERAVLRDLTTDARDEYQRLGVLSDAFSLDGFAGIDVVAGEIEVDVEEITDGLAMVRITDGEFSLEVDGDELVGNLGEVVEAVADEREFDLEVDDVEEEADAEELPASFAVVEEDGRWHPSITFTIAELVRQGSFEPLDEPDLGRGVEPDGEDSAEEAVQALIDAGTAFDAEAAIALLDPGEARALQVYSQFFLPLDAEAPEDLQIDAELTDAEVDDLGGGRSRVVPTGFELRFESDGGTGEVVLDDGCFRVDLQPADDSEEPLEEEVCTGEEGGDVLPDALGDVEIPPELQEVAEAFLPLRFGVVTVERDGEHFVAPVRTLADSLLGFTRGLEPEDLEDGGAVFALLSGDLDDEVEDLLDQIFESSFVLEDEPIFEDDLGFDPDEDCEGVGCGFGDDDEGAVERVPTGASGPNGELLVFDVVEGSVGEGATATFTAIADIDGDFFVGAQGVDGFDSLVRVFDAATGELLDENDDFFGTDPEVLLQGLSEGQVLTIEIAGFANDPGDFVVYFEPV